MAAVWERADLDPYERLVVLCLADHSDDDGRCYPAISRLVTRTGMAERGVQTVIKRLASKGVIAVEKNAGRRGANVYTILPTPAPHAPRTPCTPAPHAPTPAPGAPNPRTPCGGTPAPGAPEPSLNHHRTVSNRQRDAREFDAFWAVYPRKVGKDAARKAWLSARKRAGLDEIVEGLRRFVSVTAGADPQFVPHPATWLNQGRWQDDQSHARNGPRSSSDDLRDLATIPATDDLARLWAPPKAISQ